MKYILTTIAILLTVLTSCVDGRKQSLDRYLEKQDSIDASQRKLNDLITQQLKAIDKQQDFKIAMDLSEVRYLLKGNKKDYSEYHRNRDSLIKWINYKDSIEKSAGIRQK